MKIDSKAIRELAGLLEETGLNEIEVSDGESSIRVNKGGTYAGAGYASAPVAIAAPLAMNSDPAVPQAANNSAPDTIAHTHPGAVTSPMVGTAYLASSPEAPTFVKKGDTVAAGDTLLIIEAMKVMNPIKAEKAGTITHIMVQNGAPVEFGDVLMVIQ